jgi:TRAP-type C4-dicarboxylate transport system permease small subunit
MSSFTTPASAAPAWFRTLDGILRRALMWVSCTLLALMVAFTVYTVVMRYVFKNPPFWGDTVALFCNIWLVLVAYALAVRDREDIATEAVYVYLSPRVISALRLMWQIMTFVFGAFLIWFGLDAALSVPGRYWELGGLPKQAPMMVLPLCGLLVTLATAANIVEGIFGWRSLASGAVERSAVA